MNIAEVLETYDNMFGKSSLEEIGAYLDKSARQAAEEEDIYSFITLLNEIIGFCRDTDQREKGLNHCRLVLEVMEQNNMKGRTEYATTMQNVANAYRAFGLYEKSEEYFAFVEKIYAKRLDQNDYYFASLYNNWSLLRQEVQDFKGAEELLRKALEIICHHGETYVQQAVTRTNLAATLLQIGEMEEADIQLSEALNIFKQYAPEDFHFSGTLSTMGDARFMAGDYKEAVVYYRQALTELEKNVGKAESYERVEEKLRQAERQKTEEELCQKEEVGKQKNMNMTGKINDDRIDCSNDFMEKCREFYINNISPMISERFPSYKGKIAVGIAGEGSECFGYSDEISTDHDFAVRLILWVTKDTYEKIGDKLQSAYLQIWNEYQNTHGRFPNEYANRKCFVEERSGVMVIEEYFEKILGAKIPKIEEQWAEIKEECLSAAVNGQIFFDEEGIITEVREQLAYYPEKIRLLRLAQEIHDFSQCGQYNYGRMMARGDYVAAQIAKIHAMEHAMNIVYLINKKYHPYYKWLRRGMKTLEILPEIGDIMDALADIDDQREAWQNVRYSASEVNGEDKIALIFEIVAELILNELKEQKLVSGEDTYLEPYSEKIAALAIKTEFAKTKEELMKVIVSLEWKQFDNVINEGGRADCQNDWNTFKIMRMSQYMTWSRELLESYYSDLREAENTGWNMITEKYARMMASTAPEEYEILKENLPVRDKERMEIQEEIIRIQVAWMEEFAEKYPHMAGNARLIHTYEDQFDETSYETYLRGEIGTYSDKTLVLYGRFIETLMEEGKNLAYLTMNNTAIFYGYLSVEDAEKRMGN